MVHNPELQRLFRVHHVPGKQHFLDLGGAGQLGEAHRTAPAGHDAQPAFRQADFRGVRHQTDIAGEGELQTAAQGVTVDRADHRGLKQLHRPDKAVSRPHKLVGIPHTKLSFLVNVSAGAECLSASGQDHAADVLILQGIQAFGDPLICFRVQRVQYLRPVQRDDGDGSPPLKQES